MLGKYESVLLSQNGLSLSIYRHLMITPGSIHSGTKTDQQYTRLFLPWGKGEGLSQVCLGLSF